MLDILPAVDYSRGGVYFLGSSNMKWGSQPWALSGDELIRVHNFGLGGSSQLGILELVKFLVDREGMLRAGRREESCSVWPELSDQRAGPWLLRIVMEPLWLIRIYG